GWGIRTVAILSFVGAVWVSKDEDREFLARLTTLVIFATLQFVGTSWTAIILFGVLSTIFYLTTLRGNRLVEREIKMWLLGVVLLFGAVIVTPALPGLFKATFEPDSDIKSLQVVDNVQGKLASYKKDAIEGSARVSMWQSSVPWIKQYWLIGSGLDTIKYMYPVFRRSDYGILEGGHNFTPDRLHNEYLNNLATRGVIATVVYYFGIILGWYLITLKGLVKLDRSPYRYILLAFMVGTTVYLGQVLFNFGVVATLVLFYLCIGIGWAISVHSDFEKGDR
ncbi:O-antigen ligase domain-containing protein, partial [bacterium]|nr:O-antigen ligase domain-containing protein [bacterium]